MPARCHALVLALCVAGAAGARGATLELVSDRDNTLYESTTGATSNGAGEHFIAGRAGPGVRRALLRFDVAGALPLGAVVDSVDLVLHVSRVSLFFGTTTLDLHRVLADWGEGASNAGPSAGTGALAAPGDATWLHTFRPGSFWGAPGGDFVAAPSASQAVTDTTFYTWGSTPQLVADVQAWLDAPGSNFGWMLRGGEAGTVDGKRFDSRENLVAAWRPRLVVHWHEANVRVAASTWAGVKRLFR